MIQANELRIGNKVFVNWIEGKKIETNHGVFSLPETILKVEQGWKMNTSPNGYFVKLEIVEPIPLSQEIVDHIQNISASFVLSKQLNGKYIFFCETGKAEFGPFGMVTIIDFVHQLQNLYFSLSGYELDVSNIK